MRYLIYARKSSESEDKQAQSIDDQLNELRMLANQRGLTVVAELIESRSAKEPGARPVFAEMVQRINSGEADGILCWHVNRLFRNPVDFGTISWMLQTGTLREIYTPHQVHRFGDNVLLLSVENGMANQYIIDLRKVVLRGLRSKIEKGWFPHRAPEGYLNRDSIIIPDPERFDQIRAVFVAVLGGRSITHILADLKKDGYRSRHKGQRLFTRTTLYNILGNIFYAGYFVHAGETHRGAHEPMVTLSEYFEVQRRIKTGNTRRRKHTFAYSGLITCGDCGCQVSGDIKTKRLASGETATYVYYCCSNAKRVCSRKVIREEAISEQVGYIMDSLHVSEGFVDFAHETIAKWKSEALSERERLLNIGQEQVRTIETKLSRLLDLRLSEVLTDQEYVKEKARLQDERARAQMEAQVSEETSTELLDNLYVAVMLLHFGRQVFESGLPEAKNLIARTLAPRWTLTNGHLSAEINPVFARFRELKKSQVVGSLTEESLGPDHKYQVWWEILDGIRTGTMSSRAVFLPLLKTLFTGCNARCTRSADIQ